MGVNLQTLIQRISDPLKQPKPGHELDEKEASKGPKDRLNGRKRTLTAYGYDLSTESGDRPDQSCTKQNLLLEPLLA